MNKSCSRRLILKQLAAAGALSGIGSLVACVPAPGGDTATSTDTGGAPRDTASSSSDTGSTVPTDTGSSPPPDTGSSPPPDTGSSPPPDTGSSPPPDTGSSPPPPGIPIDLSDPANSILTPVGGVGYLSLSGDRLIIVHETNNVYIVLSAVCTHQGCTVEYDPSYDDLACPCHGAAFNMAGGVTRGPAQRPLKKYNTQILNNILYIDATP